MTDVQLAFALVGSFLAALYAAQWIGRSCRRWWFEAELPRATARYRGRP